LAVQKTYLLDLFFRQLRRWVLFSWLATVLENAQKLKIAKLWISTVTVVMVYIVTRRNRTEKCLSDKVVHFLHRTLAVLTKRNRSVTSVVEMVSHNETWLASSTWPYPLNTSKIRHFIPTF